MVATLAAGAAPVDDAVWERAEQGDPEAQLRLGTMYEFGEGVARDHTMAAGWYRLAAGQGFDAAQYMLASLYDHGKGVPKDDREAVRWYRLAAEQGHDNAQFNLGIMYALGTGVPVDFVRAYAWLNVAAARGASNAEPLREILADKMDRARIMEAQALSREIHDRMPTP